VTCCIVGMFWWFAICMMMRYTLKMLLMYKGFMFEGRGSKISLKTKVWGVLVKCELMKLRGCDGGYLMMIFCSLRQLEHAIAVQLSRIASSSSVAECQGHNAAISEIDATAVG
jgi:hypothetical protein